LIAGLLAAGALMPAQSRLQLKISTSTPDGYSVNSTLVYGDHDAILIDSQFLLSEAHRLAAMILESKTLQTLDQIADLHPAIVVAGHQIAGAPTDASTIEFMKEYTQCYDQAATASKSADELREKVKSRYPNLGLQTLLDSGSRGTFQ